MDVHVIDVDVMDTATASVPILWAHRGSCRLGGPRENTIDAFVLAAELGADGVELDARRTADAHLVVHHDSHLPLDAGPLAGSEIATVDLESLREHAPWIPTLSEALSALGVMKVDIEVKNIPGEAGWDSAQGTAVAVAELIGEFNAKSAGTGSFVRSSQVIVTSFDPGAIAKVRAIDPDIRTGWLVFPGFQLIDALNYAVESGTQLILPHFSALGGGVLGEFLAATNEAGVQVHAWTVDDPGVAEELCKAGVHGIITNDVSTIGSVIAGSKK